MAAESTAVCKCWRSTSQRPMSAPMPTPAARTVKPRANRTIIWPRVRLVEARLTALSSDTSHSGQAGGAVALVQEPVRSARSRYDDPSVLHDLGGGDRHRRRRRPGGGDPAAVEQRQDDDVAPVVGSGQREHLV